MAGHSFDAYLLHIVHFKGHFVLFQNNNTGILIVAYVWNGMALFYSEIDHLRWAQALTQ